MWSSDLRPVERLVALCFASWGEEKDVDVWVSYDKLVEQTGLARSTAAAAIRTLVDRGYLRLSQPARQHYSARYRLVVQPSDTRTSEQSDTRTPDRPDVRQASPDVRLPSPDVRHGDPTALPHHTPTPAAGPPVIVEPQDREPQSEENLADQCRALPRGRSWTDGDVRLARQRIADALGGGAAGMGQAAAALRGIAAGHGKPVQNLRGFLDWVELNGGLASLRVGTGEPKAERVIQTCPDHPGSARRPDGECGGCRVDRLELAREAQSA